MKNVLCFGDSNTWGYIPVTQERYTSDERWTGLLQKMLDDKDIQIIEEGLCGRTTVFEDRAREGKKGIDALNVILENNDEPDAVILMLGTNDCKAYLNNTAKSIAKGIEKCLDSILNYVPSNNVILVSPIHLGDKVWMEQYDPEFDKKSITVSKKLKKEYLKIVKKKSVRFLAASDYCVPSVNDQEHLSVEGHKKLADVFYKELKYLYA